MSADWSLVDLSPGAVLDASPDVVVLVDADGRIVYTNDRVSDLLGYEPEELAGEAVEVIVPEADRDEHVERRDEYMAGPVTRPMAADLDLRARRKDGSTVPVDVALSPIGIAGDRHVMAVVRDISEREGLRRKYRTILEAVPDAVVVADVSTGEIVEANEQVRDLLGLDPDDLIGEAQAVLHPAGEEARYRDLFERHVASGRRIFAEFPDGSDVCVETAEGERIPVEINAHVFELGDRRLIAGVFRDVSARRNRERQLEALHATTRELMEVGSREELADVVAEAASSILGYSGNVVRFVVDGTRMSPVAVTARARSELGPRPDYPLDGDNPGAAVYESGEPLLYEDVRALDDGYDRGDVRSAMYVPMGDHGMISIVDPSVGAFDRSDVELASILAAAAETALNRLAYEQELGRQNERLDRFAGVVSHDLRNPLTVAMGWLDHVEESEERERIAGALDRMSAIVEDTLTLARQGQSVAERTPVDLADLATECWTLVSTADAVLEVAGEIEVLGDRRRLRHVLENLFRNAVEHGGSDVRVTVGALPGEEGFYVADDGPGIPSDEREEVFEPGRTTDPSGTGFGLSIVREIVEAHGWEVRVRDAPDGGVRFEFTGVEFA